MPAGSLATAIGTIAAGRRIGEELAALAFTELMAGAASPAQAAALLMGLRVQGETGAEVAGAVRAMRRAMVPVTSPANGAVIDTCGTGGGRVPTFNISTTAALVAVGAGATVAKHGNRSFTSKCGSADVLEALGIELAIDAARAGQLLAETRMAFLFAPAFHPAMKHVMGVRRELGIPTIMNLLGPLSNPAGVRRQVVGVADAERGPLLADALCRLGAQHALVVHGEVGMDEVAPRGRTLVWEVRDGAVTEWTIDARAHALETADLDALRGEDPDHNAARVRRLLERPAADPAGRAAVLLNAAAAIYVSGLATTYPAAVERARASLDEGRAADALERFVGAAGGARTSG